MTEQTGPTADPLRTDRITELHVALREGGVLHVYDSEKAEVDCDRTLLGPTPRRTFRYWDGAADDGERRLGVRKPVV